MENLWRFVLLRPPSKLKAHESIDLSQNSEFQRQLRTAVKSDTPAESARERAATFAAGNRFITQPLPAENGPDGGHLTFGAAYRQLDELIRARRSSDTFGLTEAAEAVRAITGFAPGDLVKRQTFQRDKANAIDSLLAIKLLKDHHNRPIADLTLAIRVMRLIDDIEHQSPHVSNGSALAEALERPLLLPPDIFPIVKHNEAIRPAGVGDLLIVKQALKGYSAQDVAHIENVLSGEKKIRDHVRRTSIEEITTAETETTTEEATELESTERYELQREVAETIREETSLEAGLTVSGRYGPTVEFEASAKGSLTNSRERSTRLAADYASSVTRRSSSRITERKRQMRTRRVLQEVEETNHHELSGGADHVIGVYQWVNKLYEAQVFNYGTRTIYDFMVPEPGAYLTESLKAKNAPTIRPPAPFTVQPGGLTEENYGEYVARYEVSGVQPPPDPQISIGKAITLGPQQGEESGPRTYTEEVTIPSDYRAVSANAVRLHDANRMVLVSVGARHTGNDPDVAMTFGGAQPALSANDTLALAGQRGANPSVPVTVWADSGQDALVISVEIWCERTDDALNRWRSTTHSAILQSYQDKRSDYEEKLASMQPPNGVTLYGRNPAQNRAVERDELKKACITLLRREAFGLTRFFDGLAAEQFYPLGPQVDVDRAAPIGNYIRFMEQAFEWHNMTYVFYPYFWADLPRWQAHINYRDEDPLFEAFLKAGAARVVVPVRPGFESAITHFMDTGEIWNGGELPAIGSELYVPIDVEVRERLGAPGDETPQGEPWEVTLPTDLAILRSDGSLPSWHKDERGHWVPDVVNA